MNALKHGIIWNVESKSYKERYGTIIKLLIIDVDGTLTDGSIIYDDMHNEIKKFCTRDGAGFFAAKEAGIQTMVLTGRECKAVTRRMQEMKVDFLFQDIKDKASFLKEFCSKYGYKKEDLGYIGDELNDLSAMILCGFVGCPADSCPEVIAIANYVSKKKGGDGAVRDVIEYLLREAGSWDNIVAKIYNL